MLEVILSEFCMFSGPTVQDICLDTRTIPGANSLRGGTAVSFGKKVRSWVPGKKIFFCKSLKNDRISPIRTLNTSKLHVPIGEIVFDQNFSTLALLIFQPGWFITVGAVLCIRGCIEASLTSPPPQMPGVPSPQSWQPKMSPDITKCPLWACLSPAEKHSFWLTVRENPLFPYLFPLPTSLQTLAISFFPSCLPLSYSFLLKPSLEGLIYIILQSVT